MGHARRKRGLKSATTRFAQATAGSIGAATAGTTAAGAGSCSWRRPPAARMVYGEQLVAAGFRRAQGTQIIGQNVVPRHVHEENAQALRAAFAAHPVQEIGCGAPQD